MEGLQIGLLEELDLVVVLLCVARWVCIQECWFLWLISTIADRAGSRLLYVPLAVNENATRTDEIQDCL